MSEGQTGLLKTERIHPLTAEVDIRLLKCFYHPLKHHIINILKDKTKHQSARFENSQPP